MIDELVTVTMGTVVVALTVALGAGVLVGMVVHRTSNTAAPVVRANRKARNRYGAQPGDVEPETTGTTTGEPDTIELPIVDDSGDVTGRQRYSDLHRDPAANMRATRRVVRQATGEVRLLSHEILTGAGMTEIFAAVYGGQADDDATPLFHETAAAVAEMPSPAAQAATLIHQAALKQLAVTR